MASVSVEFRLLGKPELWIDAASVDIGTPKQAVVLAALLLAEGQPVEIETLVDRLWAGAPPAHCRNVLASYVSRLRRVLAAGQIEIAQNRGCYRLRCDPEWLDVFRFRRATRQARAAAARADHAEAVAQFDRALSEWHGAALAGLPGAWIEATAAGLERDRRDVEAARIDALLRWGRYGEAVSDLQRLVADHHVDEQFTAQLMDALHRTGRTADSIAAYQALRERLAEAYGLDPSPALAEQYVHLLRSTGAPPALPPGPAQLPAGVPVFVGRAGELSELNRLLPAEGAAGPVIWAIFGSAGVGKTTLAVYWSHQIRHRFPGGQLYVNLRGFDPGDQTVEPAVALRGFLDAFEVPPERIPFGLDAQAALYRSLIADRRVLVVLDNARDADQVRPLLPGSPGCLVLVTSRSQVASLVTLEGAHPLMLDVMSRQEAQQLLIARLSAGRVTADPDAAQVIITRCARLPLALAIVAARAATHPSLSLSTLADELAEAHRRLDALSGDDAASDLRTVLSWSYQALSAGAARLFRLLGQHPGPDFSASAAASLYGVPPVHVRPLLTELADANLLLEHTPGRYTFHDLLRAYAAELAGIVDTEPARYAAVHRLLDYYLHTAYTASRLLDPHRDPIAVPLSTVDLDNLTTSEQAAAWFKSEHQVLLAAIEQAHRSGLLIHTWQLAWTMVDFLDRGGHWRDLAATHRVALDAAQRLADGTAQAYVHRSLARAYARMGQYDDADAHLRHALDLFTALGDDTSQARTLLSLAWLSGLRDDNREALRHARRALVRYRRAGHKSGQADALNNVGWFSAQLGDHQRALTYCQQAIVLHQETGDRHSEAQTWDSIGFAHHHLGRHRQAIDAYQQAIELYESLGDRYLKADVLAHLGDVHRAAGDQQLAQEAWQRALTILDDLGHPDADDVRDRLAALNKPHPASPPSETPVGR